MTLVDLSSNLFALIVQLRASDDYGELEPLRQRIGTLFDQFSREGEASQARSQEVRDATYAIMALVDEIIVRSQWAHKVIWLRRPLMYEKFDTANAGEGFFRKLEETRQNPAANQQLLEIYYLCLVLGFKGKYLTVIDSGPLKEIIADLGRVLNLQSRKPTVLSPRWKRTHEALNAVRPALARIPIWLVALSCLLITMVIYLAAVNKMDGMTGVLTERFLQRPAVIQNIR